MIDAAIIWYAEAICEPVVRWILGERRQDLKERYPE
jgi:hypothetical protein